jgi:hypothetical protein
MATYNSFAGVDITAVFGDKVFGELQMVSYKSDREKGPIYVMGSPDPVSFARGKRLVSGACVFVVFDQDTLVNEIGRTEGKNDSDDPKAVFLSKQETANFGQDGFANTAAKAASNFGGTTRGQVGNISGATNSTLGAKVKDKRQALLHDQILPFDITLVAANEYGSVSKMIIHGVELMTAAGGMSIDDLVIEKQVSFLAKRITDWRRVQDANTLAR